MRSVSMRALTGAVKGRWPGVVVYGVGDEPHKRRISDHNEDDTAGSRPAQTDPDNVPEHRAIDVMLGAHFTRADGYALVEALIRDPRIWYLVFDHHEWSRDYGWRKLPHAGDPHTDHVHVSGLASQDESTAEWPRVTKGEILVIEPTDVQAIEREIMTNGAMVQLFYRLEAVLALRPSVTYPDGRKEVNALAVRLADIDARLDSLAVRLADIDARQGK